MTEFIQGEIMSNYDVLDTTVAAAKAWLQNLDDQPVGATATLNDLRSTIRSKLENEGLAADQVINELVHSTKGGLHASAGGRFFAWVIGGSVPSALAADWLTSTWDQNAALYACGPAASVIEEIAGEWIKELLDLPREASFAFTTGCQLAHFTCLAAARSAVLKRAGWDVNQDGLFQAPPIRILTSEHRHGSIDRAIRYLGFGNKSLQSLAADENGQVRPETLEKALGESNNPTILVLDAADLNIAAFDPFIKLIPMAQKAGAWVHIDGAFGLFARASRTKRYLTEGIEQADSWATDGHKWLNVPFDCGVAIIKDREAHRDAMTIRASYIAPQSQARDQIDWNPEWSRRARGIPVYAALRELGKNGVEELIDRTSRHCHTLVTEIGKLPGVEVLWEPTLNQGLLRFLDPKPNATNVDHDTRTNLMIQKINAKGEAFFSPTTWRGMIAMRVSVVNWQTTDEDIKIVVESIKHSN